ncbi:MAG: plastocyanin/azurin family copper-binding protein [Actinomycetota bacterium]|nr:plastocyanin/azurin family copper-binding protein [Actinomycetota bacterium]
MRAFTAALLLTVVALGATACGQSSSAAPTEPSAAATDSSEAAADPSEAAGEASEAAGGDGGEGGGGGGKPADALIEGKPADASERITLRKSLFTTEQLQVRSGTTVAWINRDPYGHTVTFDPILDSGVLAGGGRYAVTFNEPGTYGFVCTVHPAIMSGEVTVKG